MRIIKEVYNNLRSLYVDQGKLIKAEEILQRAFNGCEKGLAAEVHGVAENFV